MVQKQKKYAALALFSGGLDSMLAVKIIQQQDIDVIPVCFVSPFFSAKKALESGKQLGIFVNIIILDEEYLEIVKDPKHGYGKNMNPCIDCHAFMYKKLGDMMTKFGADFLISGEVLGQRPKSQNLTALNTVAKQSGYKDVIVRPLSQKLLPDTKPITEGWVDKAQLLDLQGRNRTPQMQIAKKFDITDYPSPAGGCLLTDPGYSKRLRDLKIHDTFEERFITFLSVGRHFRLDDNTKLILGRNKHDNEYMSKLLSQNKDGNAVIMQVREIPGPMGIIQTNKENIPQEIFSLAAEILVRYTSKVENKAIVLCNYPDGRIDKFVIDKRMDGFEKGLRLN
ncbi:MAG TPA: DUF814 domain-containing protein [Candidatus Cloacimonetes bacterium]|nr:DUF814 domain-containing protein [Candidatus Cloacimonadota bacterium]HEX37759.1 DUF814 domain-containing protein [Candidatus Cloacimonadota bacterium]